MVGLAVSRSLDSDSCRRRLSNRDSPGRLGKRSARESKSQFGGHLNCGGLSEARQRHQHLREHYGGFNAQSALECRLDAVKTRETQPQVTRGNETEPDGAKLQVSCYLTWSRRGFESLSSTHFRGSHPQIMGVWTTQTPGADGFSGLSLVQLATVEIGLSRA